jgi:hypothetical protein
MAQRAQNSRFDRLASKSFPVFLIKTKFLGQGGMASPARAPLKFLLDKQCHPGMARSRNAELNPNEDGNMKYKNNQRKHATAAPLELDTPALCGQAAVLDSHHQRHSSKSTRIALIEFDRTLNASLRPEIPSRLAVSQIRSILP